MLRASDSGRILAAADWQALLGEFATVGLAEVSDTAATNRTDTKFLLPEAEVPDIVRSLTDEYRVLDIDGLRFTGYRTQYFDTESFALFRRHHVGAGNRIKIRSRTYLNTRKSFIEIKSRSRKGATTKLRQETATFETGLGAASLEYIARHCPAAPTGLLPTLRNGFERISLVGAGSRERLTIDLNVQVESDAGAVALPGVAVAEFKQERNGHHLREASFLKLMRARNIRPTGFSKYCIGLLLTHGEIKHNLFRPQLRKLHRVMGEPNAVC